MVTHLHDDKTMQWNGMVATAANFAPDKAFDSVPRTCALAIKKCATMSLSFLEFRNKMANSAASVADFNDFFLPPQLLDTRNSSYSRLTGDPVTRDLRKPLSKREFGDLLSVGLCLSDIVHLSSFTSSARSEQET